MELLPPRYRVVTVAGTNGKGSTVAYLDALLRGAGRRTGRFTSPHLVRYNERICVDGVEASDAELIASFERIDAARADITLTFFEYNALAALDLFARAARRCRGARSGAGRPARRHQHHRCGRRRGLLDRPGSRRLAGRLARADRPRESWNLSPRAAGGAGQRDPCRASVWKVIEEMGARPVAPGQRISRARARSAAGISSAATCACANLPLPAFAGGHQIGNAATALAAIACGDFGVKLDHAAVSRRVVRRARRRALSTRAWRGRMDSRCGAQRAGRAKRCATTCDTCRARVARWRSAASSATRTFAGIAASAGGRRRRVDSRGARGSTRGGNAADLAQRCRRTPPSIAQASDVAESLPGGACGGAARRPRRWCSARS